MATGTEPGGQPQASAARTRAGGGMPPGASVPVATAHRAVPVA